MARPTEYEYLTTTTLKIEREALNTAKREGLNLSDIFRRAVDQAIGAKKESNTKKEKTPKEFKFLPKTFINNMSAQMLNAMRQSDQDAEIKAETFSRIMKGKFQIVVSPNEIQNYVHDQVEIIK
jgi:post-segregation antitoxin (ccd killing protein)